MKKISYYLFLIVLVGGVIVSFWIYNKYFKKDEGNYILFKVIRGSINEMVKARGEVVSQKDFDLEFPFTGIVDKIFVKEGQSVDQGDQLMKLDTTDFDLEKRRLESLLSQSQASLEKLKSGATKEDIQISQTQVSNAQKSLSDAQTNLFNITAKANLDLANLYGDIKDIVNDAYAKAEDAVNKQTDELFINDLSATPQLSFITSDAQAQADAESKRVAANTELKTIKSILDNLNNNYSDLDLALSKTQTSLSVIRDFLIRTNDALNSAVGLSQSDIAAYKANLSTARTNVNTAITAITSQQQSISSQKASNQNNIDTAQSQVNSAQNSLAIAQAELDLKKAGARLEDVQIAEAKIRETIDQIAIIDEKIKKSTIYSPGPAKVIKIYFEHKEIFNPGRPAISLSAFEHKIQSDISELDIGKIRDFDGNTVSIKLDAFPEEKFDGRVISIDPKEIIKEGDKYYRVNFYLNEHKANVRPGMSADLVIDISSKENVLKVPELVVYKKEDRKYVKILDNNIPKEIEIKTGISDGEYVEVVSGLSEGQSIILSTD